ncbi:MAG: tetratricopeptide repeat protein [Terriglobia bacterium]
MKSTERFINVPYATAALMALVVLSAALAAASSDPALSTTVSRADDYYQGRRDLDNVRKALAILQADVSQHPADYAAWWRISEYDCYLARHVPDRKRKPILQAGFKAGREAEKVDDAGPEGHFWTGANEGLLAEESGLIAGLRMVGSIRSEMQTVMKLAPAYQQYGAERILGRLYYRLPFFAGGNKQLSLHLLQDCLKRYPDNSLTLLYLADVYRSVGRPGEARALLERVLKLCPDPDYGPEQADNQAVARHELQTYFHASG